MTGGRRLRIYADPTDPETCVILVNDSVPGGIPVIPTPVAESYWMHPTRQLLTEGTPWSVTPDG